MNWFYWNTAWSLFFSLVWFMTITHNPDARIADAHLRDEAFGGCEGQRLERVDARDARGSVVSAPSRRSPLRRRWARIARACGGR
jgi:hypothetical protein